jgi:hypothetical protein
MGGASPSSSRAKLKKKNFERPKLEKITKIEVKFLFFNFFLGEPWALSVGPIYMKHMHRSHTLCVLV